MNDYEKICDFQNLYQAHRIARRGKRNTTEVIQFEADLAQNLTTLSALLREKQYHISGYYTFMVHDPKDRHIHALHYRDRVVQHCLCDQIIAPTLDRKLIYDNAACRIGKGTHFALNRVSKFMRKFYRKYGTQGYILKCDIRKFFDNIDHDVLKQRLRKVFTDNDILWLCDQIIDSYESSPHKGLPHGNQTSQWFAIYYLDGFDRLIKEKLQIKYYSRYMDDCVLIHRDKAYLQFCLEQLNIYITNELHLEFNVKTQIFPIKNGVDYLGWHFYLSETGKVIRNLRRANKVKYKHRLCRLRKAYAQRKIDIKDIQPVMMSYIAHLAHGHTHKLQAKVLRTFV